MYEGVIRLLKTNNRFRVYDEYFGLKFTNINSRRDRIDFNPSI